MGSRMLVKALHLSAALGALLIGVTLAAWGQPLVSTSGEIRIWVGSIWSTENSQQIADWYSLSHFVQGMLVVALGRPFRRWIGYAGLLSFAVVVGVAWEIIEHTEWVLSKFRATTIYQGYVGDTVLNAVCDYVFMLGGFFLALRLPTLWLVCTIVAIDLTSALIARDSLTLTTLHLVYPIEAIDTWQAEINPGDHGRW